MNTDKEVLKKVYTAENHEDLMDAYKDWAKDYDNDTVGEFGYVAPKAAAESMLRYLDDRSARILDAGCGTGLVAEVLKPLGFTNIDALDYSAEMLEEAEKKGVYRECMQVDMSKPMDIADNAYDALICVGTFTYGHVTPEAFEEVIRVVKPGGIVTFTVREGAYDEHDYRPKMLQLECDGKWELQEMRDETYFEKENVSCKVCTYRVA
ncbi:class I SAM-dependent DNA methyltransferase [Desulfohalovibrio reitneri]|uniref:class I SAM-dependent DNA methyltransferase n=1 Tax=Desulfohalovibrio reitneri TaxID=1307759 RepID=UPI0004A75904|nr:class I SAM-dependent methyltransferase [Desulfohalovibrio reitneri]